MALQSVATRGAGVVSQLLVAKLLTPEDFGLVAIALGVSVVVTALRDAGVRQILVQRPAEFESLAGPVTWLNLALSIAGAAALCIAAPFVGRANSSDALPWMLALIALSVPLAAPAALYTAKLQIDLRFRQLAIVQSIPGLVRSLGVVLLALAGAGPLSFVIPIPIASLLEWFLAARHAPARLWSRPLDLGRWPGIFATAKWLILTAVAIGIINAGTYPLIGRVVGKETTGLVYFAWNIIVQVGVLVSANITPVLFSALTKMAGDRERQARAIRRSVRQLLLIGAPMAMGLIPTFHPLDELLWGGKYAEATPAVIAFAALYPLAVVASVQIALLQAQGAFRTLALTLIATGVGSTLAGFGAAHVWGTPLAIAVAGVGTQAVVSLIVTAMALRSIDITAVQLLKDALPTWLIALVAAAVAWLVVRQLPTLHPVLARPIVKFVLGGTVFVALNAILLRAIWPAALREALLIVPARLAPLARKLLVLPTDAPASR